jgi:glycerol-3-phosphate dehydrogenase (NAD(P)+)
VRLHSVSIIGGGAWGTALAQTLALGGHAVALWAREPEVVDDINIRHVNRVFLPGIDLDPSIRATGDLAALAVGDVVLAVVPAQHLRFVMGQLAPHLAREMPVVVCSKGIEQETANSWETSWRKRRRRPTTRSWPDRVSPPRLPAVYPPR